MLVGALAVEPSTVTAAAKSSITLNQTKKTIYVGEYTTVKVVKVTGLKSKSVTYKTSNKKIATVTSKGVVKGIKAGKATITVTSKSNSKVKSKFTVTVKEVKRMSKSDFDISGFTGGGLTDKATGKLYTNYIDYIIATNDKIEYGVFYDDGGNEDCYSDADPETYATPRGIKLGSSKKTVLSKYPSKHKLEDSSYRKMLEGFKDFNTKEHKAKSFVGYGYLYKHRYYRIHFVFDQNDKLMGIIF